MALSEGESMGSFPLEWLNYYQLAERFPSLLTSWWNAFGSLVKSEVPIHASENHLLSFCELVVQVPRDQPSLRPINKQFNSLYYICFALEGSQLWSTNFSLIKV